VFLGHFAVGFAAKRVAPKTSLGWLITAPILPDLLWPLFLLGGWETVRIDPGNTAFTPLAFDAYPWSHSLEMVCVWAALLAGIYLGLSGFRRGNASRPQGPWDVRGAWVIGAAVVSHWVLDVVTHRPDMPVTVSGPARLGLGLWNSVPATMAVEGLMFAAGVGAYASMTRPRDRVGSRALNALVPFLALLYASVAFGPPPPSVHAIAFSALAACLLPLWAVWIDNHRTVRERRATL
jgi:hypothetical protein